MLPPTLSARLEKSEGQEQMDGFRGEQGGREVRRERESKARETKFKLPSSSVQSHSSTRQICLKYSSGLGSSVSSATNSVSTSASSC